MARTIIKTGEAYGKIGVLEVDSPGNQRKNKTFLCKCLICGEKFVLCGQDILKNQSGGCGKCRATVKSKNRENAIKSHIGEIYGDLKIIEFDGFKKTENRKNGDFLQAWVKCKCLKCDSETLVLFKNLKSGGAKQCKKCAEKNLLSGQQIGKAEFIEGTLISAIDGHRKINKNNLTGHTGVNYHAATGKYRAYINFKRKQYHLGLHDTLEQAVAARAEAEKRIYGDFLKWYQEKHPDQWKNIQSRKGKNK